MGDKEMESIETRYGTKIIGREEYISRFDIHQRIQHFILMLSFTLLALTGLPQKFHDWSISQWWTGVLGGMDNVRTIHHYAAYVLIFVCVYHVSYIMYNSFIRKRPFPVKMIPTPGDVKNMFLEISYLLGLKDKRPKYDRFEWKQKFDYWAIFWGMPVIGISGFIMMYPVFVTKYLPGWAVPSSIIAHGDEAILAVVWIFVVHFFFNHLSPGNFPLNTSIFTGRVPRERYKEEHPLEYERLLGAEERKGKD